MAPGISIGSAFGSISLDLNALRSGAQQARATVRGIGTSFADLDAITRRTADQLGGSITRINGTIGTQQRQLAILQTELEQVSKRYGEGSTQAQRKQLAIDKLTSSIQQNQVKQAGLKSDLDAVNQQLGRATLGFDQFRNNLQQTGSQLTQTGAILTASITAPLALIGKKALTVGIDYETGMNMIQAETKAAGDVMERVGQRAQELGADLDLPSASAADATTAMLELVRAGLSLDDAMTSAKATLQLAAIGEMDVGEAAKFTANSLNAFKLKGEDAIGVVDMLASASSKSSASVDDLRVGYQQAAFMFNATRQSSANLATSLAVLTNVGLTGSDSGTALKNAMQRLIDPTKEARAVMTEYGVSVYDANGVMLPLEQIIGILNRQLGGLTDQERNAALSTIFLSDGMKAMIPLLDLGEDGFVKLRGEITQQGAASEKAAAMMKGLGGAVEGFSGVLETAILQNVVPFLGILAELVRGGSAAITTFMQLDEGTRQAALAFVAVLAAAGPVQLILGGLASGLAFVLTPAGALVIGLAALAAIVVKNRETIHAWVQVIASTVESLGGLNQIVALASGVGAAYATMVMTRMVPALIAKGVAAMNAARALAASTAAAAVAAAPFIAIGIAIYGVVRAYQMLGPGIDESTQKLLNSRKWWRESSDVLARYEQQSDQVSESVKRKADALQELRTQQEHELADLQRRMTLGPISQEQYDREMAVINERADAIARSTQELNREISAEEEQREALEAKRAALEAAREAVKLTSAEVEQLATTTKLSAEQIEDLTKRLKEVAEEGPRALQAVVSAENSWLAEREQRHADHAARLAELQQEYATATTDEQRAAIAARITAEQEDFAAQELQTSVEYAKQQAAQRQHLGQMLIDYTQAQGAMRGISAERIDELTSKIADEFGVQRDLSAETFGGMTQDIDAWLASSATSADGVVSHLSDVTQEAAATQRQIEELTRQRTLEIIQEYEKRGKYDPEELALALSKIPAQVQSEVITTYRSVEERADEAGSTRGKGQGRYFAGARATGGTVSAGLPYLVGEQRPEIFVPEMPGYVLPNAGAALEQLRRAAPVALPTSGGLGRGGRGGINLQVPITIQGAVIDNAERLAALANQIESKVMSAVGGMFDQLVLEGI